MTVLSHSDVDFVPSRMVPTFGDLTVATATTLAREFGTCPHCDEPLDPDTKHGMQSDRDVIWEDPNSHRDRTKAYVCEACEGRSTILVEEKAQPQSCSQPLEHLEEAGYAFIEREDKDRYIVTLPSAIMVHPLKRPEPDSPNCH